LPSVSTKSRHRLPLINSKSSSIHVTSITGDIQPNQNLQVRAAPAAPLSPFLRSRIRSSQSREFFSPARRSAPIRIVLVRTGTRGTGAALLQRKMRCFIGEEPDSPKRSGCLTTRLGAHDGDRVPLHSVEARARFRPRFMLLPHTPAPQGNLVTRIQRLDSGCVVGNISPADRSVRRILARVVHRNGRQAGRLGKSYRLRQRRFCVIERYGCVALLTRVLWRRSSQSS
jgi:hypothetical protein